MPFDPTKAGEEADSMIAALNQPTQAENQDQPAIEAIAAPEATQSPEIPENTSEQAVQQPPTADISAQLAELRKQAETADQRWRVLQGMIDKKDSEIDSLRLLLAQLSQQQQPSAQPSTPVSQSTGKVTATDIQEYGAELIDLIGRKADEIVDGRLAPLLQQLNALSQSLNTVAHSSSRSAEQQFKAAMTQVVPEWEALNNDPGFLAWLQQPAPFTKEPKLDLLRRAASELDAARAAEFFLEFKRTLAPAKAEETPPPAAPNAARFAAPGRSKAPAARVENPAGGRMWTRADIAKLYDDKMAGRISQKEFDELERDIFKAQRENRIAA
jgi:hypothetical protein